MSVCRVYLLSLLSHANYRLWKLEIAKLNIVKTPIVKFNINKKYPSLDPSRNFSQEIRTVCGKRFLNCQNHDSIPNFHCPIPIWFFTSF